MKIDILAIGAHPDDVEIGVGGIIASHVAKGFRVGILDLTMGEMSSNGTQTQRSLEAKEGAQILGAEFRLNLALPDTAIKVNEENIIKVVEVLREYQPNIILAPFYKDFHPDHENTGKLIKQAVFFSGLKKYQAKGERFRPLKYYFYQLASEDYKPSIIVDTSLYHHIKIESIKAHKSQVSQFEGSVKTRINDGFIQKLISRDEYYGRLIGKKFGEPLYSIKEIGVENIMELG